jgi:protoporphyrinogen oxidase
MANNIAFQIQGKTTRINVSTTANTVSILSDSPCNQVRIHNGTAAEVFIRLGIASTEDAVIPTAGTPAYGTLLHNNQTVILTAPKQTTNTASLYVSAIVASGTGIIYVTPGEGL